MQPDTRAAIDFLYQWGPEGPWVLTAISTDKKSIKTRCFTAEHSAEMEAWIVENNGNRNLYFQVNPSIRNEDVKSARTNIQSLSWLHVDVDPRPGEDLQDERDRALKMLQAPPSDVPPPTVIVDSGGGYQAFWALEEPFEIGGKAELYDLATAYNRQIEMIFCADSCHNVDRIMRIPGTINLPDKVKKEKGRQPALAKLVLFDPERVYPLSMFRQAQLVQNRGEGAIASQVGRVNVRLDQTATRLAGIEDLDQWNVPDRIRVIVVQGRHPEEGAKKEDDSRSAWLFDCLCGLVRADVPDEVIYSIVTDPDFGISASVLDKGTNSENYAMRQIGRAKEFAIDPQLTALNDKHAVVNVGGRCTIIEEVVQHIGDQPRTRLVYQPFQDFRNRYMNQSVMVGTDPKKGPIYKRLGDWWLEHENRRQYEGIVFSPGRDIPGQYNLWRGFTCAPRAGDCSLFLNHIRENICGGVKEYLDYLLGWMAMAVQQPARPGHTAIVLRGSQGVGKSFFAKTFGNLFGRHFMQVSDPKHLVGSFNAHQRDCVVLFGDEAFYAGDKRHEGVLKTLITEEHLQIERKGFDVETSPNYMHIILASNSSWVIPAGDHERRFFVLDVKDDVRQNSDYFKKIASQLSAGGNEALLHYLLNYDLSGFQVRSVPKTSALREQQSYSLSVECDWWLGILMQGHIFRGNDVWQDGVLTSQLQDHYLLHAKTYHVFRPLSAPALGTFLRKLCPGLEVVQRVRSMPVKNPDGSTSEVSARRRVYIFPSLQLCRDTWDEVHGQVDWPQEPDDGDSAPREVF